MTNLATLLVDRGDREDGRGWYERANAAGDASAGQALQVHFGAGIDPRATEGGHRAWPDSAFTHGHVQQHDQVVARVLVGLDDQVPGLIIGAETPDGIAFLDVVDTICEVRGYAKQGAAYGYSKVRGLDAQLSVLSTPIAALVIARARLRRGNVYSATGAGRMLAQAIGTAGRH